MSDLVYRTIKPSDIGGRPTVFAIPAETPVEVMAAPTNQIAFGITFNLNGQLVPISTDSIADMAAKGLELGIPGPVVIGTIDNFITWFNTQFGVTLPDPSTFPSPLDQIFGKITSLVWTVNQAHVKIPPKGSSDATLYTLTIAAAWEGAGVPLIPGVLSIQGGVFGVSNEAPKTGS